MCCMTQGTQTWLRNSLVGWEGGGGRGEGEGWGECLPVGVGGKE